MSSWYAFMKFQESWYSYMGFLVILDGAVFGSLHVLQQGTIKQMF